MSPPGVEPVLSSWKVVTASPPSRTNIYYSKYEGGCLKRAHLANTNSQGFYQGFSQGLNTSPPGIEPVLSSWKVVTALPRSRRFIIYNLSKNNSTRFCFKKIQNFKSFKLLILSRVLNRWLNNVAVNKPFRSS